MTLQDRITRLRELLTKITQGEWTTGNCSNGGVLLQRQPQEGQYRAIQSHVQILPSQDAEFIVLCRNSIQEILDRNAELEQENQRLREVKQ